MITGWARKGVELHSDTLSVSQDKLFLCLLDPLCPLVSPTSLEDGREQAEILES